MAVYFYIQAEIPASFLKNPKRPLFESKFGFDDFKTLVSYVPKKNKAVLLMSTFHHDKCLLDEKRKFKPEIIDFYNKTKGN